MSEQDETLSGPELVPSRARIWSWRSLSWCWRGR